MDEVSQERLDDAWDEGFAHGYSRGNEEGLKIAFKDGYDFGAKTVSAEFVAEIEQLRKALLDAVGFVSRADSLFLKETTKDTLKGIPDGNH